MRVELFEQDNNNTNETIQLSMKDWHSNDFRKKRNDLLVHVCVPVRERGRERGRGERERGIERERERVGRERERERERGRTVWLVFTRKSNLHQKALKGEDPSH